MRGRPAIQKFFASVLLLLFTISFTPKSYFHDLFANHQDVIPCEHPGKDSTCIHQKGYSCSFTELVVSTPYLAVSTSLRFVELDFKLSLTSSYTSLDLKDYFFLSESRGPPSKVVA